MSIVFSEPERARNEMTGALVGLSRALEGKEYTKEAMEAIVNGLSAVLPGCTSDLEELRSMTEAVRREKLKAAPDCATCKSPCGRTDDYDMEEMWNSAEALRSKKFLLLAALSAVGTAAGRGGLLTITAGNAKSPGAASGNTAVAPADEASAASTFPANVTVAPADEAAEQVFHFLRDGLFLLGYAYEAGQLDNILSQADAMYHLCLLPKKPPQF